MMSTGETVTENSDPLEGQIPELEDEDARLTSDTLVLSDNMRKLKYSLDEEVDNPYLDNYILNMHKIYNGNKRNSSIIYHRRFLLNSTTNEIITNEEKEDLMGSLVYRLILSFSLFGTGTVFHFISLLFFETIPSSLIFPRPQVI